MVTAMRINREGRWNAGGSSATRRMARPFDRCGRCRSPTVFSRRRATGELLFGLGDYVPGPSESGGALVWCGKTVTYDHLELEQYHRDRLCAIAAEARRQIRVFIAAEGPTGTIRRQEGARILKRKADRPGFILGKSSSSSRDERGGAPGGNLKTAGAPPTAI